MISRVENTLLLLLLILSPCIVTEVEGFLHKRTRSENVRKQISIIPNQFNQDITAHASQEKQQERGERGSRARGGEGTYSLFS